MAIFVANWKMNCSNSFLSDFVTDFKFNLGSSSHDGEIIIAPPFCYISTLFAHLKDLDLNYRIKIAGQDCSEYVHGSHTGKISSQMLYDCGCDYIIIGHSEVRNEFEDELLRKKIDIALSSGLKVIFCIGDNVLDDDIEKKYDVLYNQLSCIADLPDENIIIAYEPVWAIGSHNSADPRIISEVCRMIQIISGKLNFIYSSILYGGSVTLDNISDIMSVDRLSGVLVGRASLNPREFAEICMFNKRSSNEIHIT